ncbi:MULTISPECIES: hypothetical protein [Pseudonocardia]|uniref:hypothetical protein n=1 Tax=Pseudonocardia TaxID=1847 RepID=UPI000A289E31|nr:MULTISPECIES: hypothetical protein [Pseudonocardia]
MTAQPDRPDGPAQPDRPDRPARPDRLGSLGPGPGGPMAELRERCAPLSFAPLPGFATAPPTAPGWIPLARIADPGDPALDRLLDARGDEPPGPRAVHTLRELLRELLFATAGSVYLSGAAPQPSAQRYLYRIGPGGIDERLLVVDRDPVGDRELAPAFVGTLAPLVELVGERTRVGSRTLWSYVVDMLHFGMMNVARQLGRDRAQAWRRAEELAGHLFEAGLPRRSVPALVRYGATDDQVWGVRGACCLDFTDGVHGMCLTCPVLDAEERARKWAASDLAGRK